MKFCRHTRDGGKGGKIENAWTTVATWRVGIRTVIQRNCDVCGRIKRSYEFGDEKGLSGRR